MLHLGTAEEVAAADHHAHPDALAGDLGDLTGDPVDHVGVDADLAAAEHLARQLHEDSLVGGHRAAPGMRWSSRSRPRAAVVHQART